ncbi:MAG TPA: sugar kinase [Pirellulales bacterium]|nr:sugar kinase [Pirellulales bacterium]
MDVDCLSVGLLVADHLCAPISHLPAAGELVVTDRLELNIGGCASNAAMDLARVGVKVAAVGCVGHDTFGRFVCDTLRDAGLDIASIKRLEGVGTSGTLIINVAGEDRRFVHAIGANGQLTVADIPRDRLRRAKVLYVGGYFVMPALAADELAALFREARAAGVQTVLDVVLPGPGDYGPALARLLPECDVFLPNDDEAAVITGLSDPRAQAEHFRQAGAATVVITCGEAGTVLATGDLRVQAAAHRVPYVGGTGAGDAFDAGYIAGLLAGGDPLECLAWGSALGASCVRSISATDSVFTRAEAEQFMRDHPLKLTHW